MLNVAIIGYGGIAKAAHVPAYIALEKEKKARLVAGCDIDPARFTQKMKINIGSSDGIEAPIQQYTDINKMLLKESIDMVDICLPTPLHMPVAADMLRRGYHVLCEKPMCRTFDQAKKLLETAKTAKGKLMIGQCLRFFPEYDFLKQAVDSGEFGKPVSAVFRRLSAPPVWAFENWYMDIEKSGGCMLDMHIHDIDMARYLFGEPDAVTCMKQDIYSGFDVVHSHLFYEDLPVLAIGDWSLTGMDFTADYLVGFEKATLISENGGVTICPRDGEKYRHELTPPNGYEREITYFVDAILSGVSIEKNPPESAATTLQLMEALKKSALSGGEKISFIAEKL